ncbi:MAG: hypothetical protein RLZZ511_3473 [Cyanobacteriota bacterium]|jgi:hypothetical protein
MNYPLPPQSAVGIGQSASVDETALVTALEVVIASARANGQSLEELVAEVLADDEWLDASQRRLLSEVVGQAWVAIPVMQPVILAPEMSVELATITPIDAESWRGPSLLAG